VPCLGFCDLCCSGRSYLGFCVDCGLLGSECDTSGECCGDLICTFLGLCGPDI
jgi:hypothetical protein